MNQLLNYKISNSGITKTRYPSVLLATIIDKVVGEDIITKCNHDNIIKVMTLLNDFNNKNYNDFINKFNIYYSCQKLRFKL